MSDRATQEEILNRVVDRLRVKIPDFSDAVCFLADQPVPPAWPVGDVACVVAVGDGRYPESFTSGGGVSTLCKSLTLGVTPWIRCNLDAIPSMDVVLNGERGLFSCWEPAILRALLLETDSSGTVTAWNPVGADGVGLLRNQIAPLNSTTPRFDATAEWLGMTVNFSIDFDWRL